MKYLVEKGLLVLAWCFWAVAIIYTFIHLNELGNYYSLSFRTSLLLVIGAFIYNSIVIMMFPYVLLKEEDNECVNNNRPAV